jgi:hypothetical protein
VTLAAANAALPRVRQLLEQLQRLQHAIDQGGRHATQTTQQLAAGNGHSTVALQDELAEEAEVTFAQLTACGAMVKDLEQGLVDFYGERAGERIFLCWRLGEELQIRYWHTLGGGFAGRQPVDSLVV